MLTEKRKAQLLSYQIPPENEEELSFLYHKIMVIHFIKHEISSGSERFDAILVDYKEVFTPALKKYLNLLLKSTDGDERIKFDPLQFTNIKEKGNLIEDLRLFRNLSEPILFMFLLKVEPRAIIRSLNSTYKALVSHKETQLAEFKHTVINDTVSNLYKFLSLHAYGQDEYKKALCVFTGLHLTKTSGLMDQEEMPSNVLLVAGGTGTGKTFLSKLASKHLSIPFTYIDCSSISPSGYVGASFGDLLVDVIKHSENGIVFIDEFDKLLAGNSDVKKFKDVVQGEILKALEGGATSGTTKTSTTSLDCSKLSFILAGSFETLRRDSKVDADKIIGFVDNKEQRTKDILKEIDDEALVKVGILPELVGRISTVVMLDSFSFNDYKKILLDDFGIFGNYKKLLKTYGATIEMTDEAADAICKEAVSLNLGVRAVSKVFAKKVKSQMFEVMSGNLTKIKLEK